MSKKAFLIIIVLFVGSLTAQAYQSSVKTIKHQAFMKKQNKGLFSILDLKKHRVLFTQKDIKECQSSMKKLKNKLGFKCEIKLNHIGLNSMLKQQTSPNKIHVSIDGYTSKDVKIKLNKKAETVTFITSFDHTGIEKDEVGFNDDFQAIYRQISLILFQKAMKQPLQFKNLEG